jgi:hypothetical protein
MHGLMPICHEAPKGGHSGRHWPGHRRAFSLLDKRLPCKERIMNRAWIFWIMVLTLACAWPFARADGPTDTSRPSVLSPSTQPDIALEFPPDLDLKVLIQYVGDRLGINFMFDEQVAGTPQPFRMLCMLCFVIPRPPSQAMVAGFSPGSAGTACAEPLPRPSGRPPTGRDAALSPRS